jgi:AcrR family transcriptional regulator
MGRNAVANRASRAASRRKLLQSARELFGKLGFAGTTMDAVARGAGVSKGLAYNYFRDKAAVLDALMEEHHRALLTRLNGLPRQEDPLRELSEMVDAVLDQAHRDPEGTRLNLGLLLQPATAPAVLRAKLHLKPEFAAYFARLEEAFVELDTPDPRADALFFTAALNGLVLAVLTWPPPVPLDALKRRLLGSFSAHSGVRRPPGPGGTGGSA